MYRLYDFFVLRKKQANDLDVSSNLESLFISLKHHDKIEKYSSIRRTLVDTLLMSFLLDAHGNSAQDREKKLLETIPLLEQGVEKNIASEISDMLFKHFLEFVDSVLDEKKEVLLTNPEFTLMQAIIIALVAQPNILKEFLTLPSNENLAVLNDAGEKISQLMNNAEKKVASIEGLCSNLRKVFKDSLEPFKQNLIHQFEE